MVFLEAAALIKGVQIHPFQFFFAKKVLFISFWIIYYISFCKKKEYKHLLEILQDTQILSITYFKSMCVFIGFRIHK